MYVRFVTHEIDKSSGKRQGLFQIMFDLFYNNLLSSDDELLWEEIRKWFNKNLEAPDRFSKSSKRHAKRVALSWFKDSAKEHISKMRQIAHILDAHGIHTEMIQSNRPGYIVYEDEFQIAAEPFNNTLT